MTAATQNRPNTYTFVMAWEMGKEAFEKGLTRKSWDEVMSNGVTMNQAADTNKDPEVMYASFLLGYDLTAERVTVAA